MIEQQLTLSDLPVSSSEIYEMMGYGNQTVPEPEIEAETQKLLKQISAIARPSFLFFSINGQLDTMKETLTVEHITFHLGKIITRQLRKSESFVFFVATAGYDFERFQQTLQQENDQRLFPSLFSGLVPYSEVHHIPYERGELFFLIFSFCFRLPTHCLPDIPHKPV